MSHFLYLKQLLQPLGVYDWEGPYHQGELLSQGEQLDGCLEDLEEIQQEMCLATASGEGLEKICALLSRAPAAPDAAQMRQALSALLRIGGDSFTLAAVGDNLSGCGINAAVAETGVTGQVTVSFPGVPGIPDDFSEMQKIIEDIIPCHLEILYEFWRLTWTELEAQFSSWALLESEELTWTELERSVLVE